MQLLKKWLNELLKNRSSDKVRETPKKLCEIRMAAVVDPITFHSFEPDINIEVIHPLSWKSQLTKMEPHLLFVESAWFGINGEWKGKIRDRPHAILKRIVAFCRSRSIPTVFWNKEDPVHFDRFIEAATLFEYVFTTDVNSIPRYQSTGIYDCQLLEFGFQPLLSNPIETHKRKMAACFAGSYYRELPERNIAFKNLIDAIKPNLDIEIYDRNFGTTNPEKQFPEEYRELIAGGLSFRDIETAYKGYECGINVNTVTDSPSMLSRRVYELIASNTLVITNKAESIETKFPTGIITADNHDDMRDSLKVLRDRESLNRQKIKLLRQVLKNDRFSIRLHQVLRRIGYCLDKSEPIVVVIAKPDTQEELNLVLHNYNRQSYRNKKLIILSDKKHNLIGKDVQVIQNLDLPRIREQLTSVKWLALWRPRDLYLAHYIEDLAIATHYCSAGVIGKNSYYQMIDGDLVLREGDTYKWVDKLSHWRSILSTSNFNLEQLPKLLMSEVDLKSVVSFQKFLSIDELNYVAHDPKAHLSKSLKDIEHLLAPRIEH
ncbi:CgeB family protein [Pseudobacteriovorax antillogorgiicola]|uniref:Glycosyl transferases group 1 n=1 Tax=Pseudobacteriovorax antillogorgiicola TaxID=1513793 RepID=A0A1Y6C5P4_9BACT|nr:glycosyltransferase [Pseudobacteriovorax antillogorgiicola]TCS51122.1 glycosyl transferase family 1 [Pseudobacteriovorax antillogorgiicola]SMF38555.1 Glycosyl transferases group 1 [Pseudobacteriovorax antillogorgiicola]